MRKLCDKEALRPLIDSSKVSLLNRGRQTMRASPAGAGFNLCWVD
jgi:hypothetical protein